MTATNAPSVMISMDDIVAIQAGTTGEGLPCATVTFAGGGAVSLPFANVRERDKAMKAFAENSPRLTAL